jgi:hypothetical protein
MHSAAHKRHCTLAQLIINRWATGGTDGCCKQQVGPMHSAVVLMVAASQQWSYASDY